MEMLCQMFFSPVRGALLHANKMQKSIKDLANYIYKGNANVMQNLIKELEDNKVFSRLENGTIINRKMYHEWQISRVRREAADARWHTKDDTKDDAKPMQMGGEAEAVEEGVGVEVVSLEVVKDKYLEFVELSLEQFKKLEKRFGEERTNGYIERLNNYIGQIGVKEAEKKYKSHYHVILNWSQKDKKNKTDLEKVMEIAKGDK